MLFLAWRRVLGLLWLGPSSDDQDVEIAVLRHQLAVLQRLAPRPRYSPADRALPATLAGLLPWDRWSTFLGRPATLRWHRQWIARRWTFSRTGPARHGIDQASKDLVARLAKEKHAGGYLRIKGELAKLGVAVSATSVRNILRRRGLGPAPRRNGPSWVEFLRAQATATLACDFLSVDTVTGQGLYMLFSSNWTAAGSGWPG